MSKYPVILETIKVASDHPDQIMLGPPFSSEGGTRYSPAALAVHDARGPLVVIGLVNYDAIVNGLFDIHKLDGLWLQIQGRFKESGGPGQQREIIGKSVPEARYSVTTRTVSAGADLSITWYVNKATSSLLYAGQCLFRTGSMPTRRARSEVNRPSGSTRRLIARRSR